MAVQAQYPTSILGPDFSSSRTRPILIGDSRNFMAPITFGPLLDEFQFPSGNGAGNQLRLFTTPLGVSSLGQQTIINGNMFGGAGGAENELACNLLGSRKRQRETDDLLNNNPRQHQILTVTDFHQNHGSGSVPTPASNTVSTGLRLTFEEDRLNSNTSPSTSGRGEVPSALFSNVLNDISSQISQQKDEFDQFFKDQGDQLRQLLEEKRVRHSRALIAAMEDGMSRRIREKDAEVEIVKRRNLELEEHVKALSMEAHIWQSKCKNSEAAVLTLKSNLQQAQQALSREQSREGCGDSEADDAASSHHDEWADAQARAFRENKELKEQRTCRVCRCNDVSILLLPCRHLCLCKDCEGRLNNCPLCRSKKDASVQVYMS